MRASQGSLFPPEASRGPGIVEKRARSEGLGSVLGVDEAGRGCLAGPVVAAAILLPPEPGIPGITDSKLLTPARRDALYDRILGVAVASGVGVVGADRIDADGILPSTLTAMRLAVDAARAGFRGEIGLVLVDGLQTIPGVELRQQALPKGDRLSLHCAAASIVAKVTRDRILDSADREFPGYGFARHKGYGTAEHLEALRRLGPSAIHRRTFRPVAAEVDAPDSLAYSSPV
jgi:ribonuclease HII